LMKVEVDVESVEVREVGQATGMSRV
jgi:hypothetical protein